MSTYTELFARHNLQVAQVFLTYDDLEDKDGISTPATRWSRCCGVVLIVNENDAVSYTELKFRTTTIRRACRLSAAGDF